MQCALDQYAFRLDGSEVVILLISAQIFIPEAMDEYVSMWLWREKDIVMVSVLFSSGMFCFKYL